MKGGEVLFNKAYLFRIYPNKEQQNLIQKTFGSCRLVYNNILNNYKENLKINSSDKFSYNKYATTLPKMKDEFSFLKEVDSIALQTSVRNLADAFSRYYTKQNEEPNFKSKKNPIQSYTTKFTNGNIKVMDKHIQLPKLGNVKYKNKNKIEGRIINATISKHANGKYFISILCEVEIKELPKTNSAVGIDLGIKNLATLSDGTVYENPKFFSKLERKLARYQRKLSKRELNSQNYFKQKQKVAKLHEHIANCRKDYLHKLTTELIKNHDYICLENLDVKSLLEEKKISKSIADVSWNKFKTFLTYKAEWYGKNVIFVDRYFPSSQICHCCGLQNKKIKNLSIRTWNCPSCKTEHDRDLNAAINILNEGLKLMPMNKVIA